MSEFFNRKSLQDSQTSSEEQSNLETSELTEIDSQDTCPVAEENDVPVPEEDVFIPNDETMLVKEASRSSATQQWSSIFTKKGPPICDTHKLPCIELVTKKPGPNFGRKFWICSKPVGPGYDNGKSTVQL